MIKRAIILTALALSANSLWAQAPKIELNDNGTIRHVVFADKGCDTLKFHAEKFDGPTLFLDGQRLPLSQIARMSYQGRSGELLYSITYSTLSDKLALNISCKNVGTVDIKDKRLTLNIGVNTTMSRYPDWRSTYFPTLFRLEESHMWGYLMSPNGGIITVTSPDPIASYELYYNNSAKKQSFSHGHRIPSFGLDLLHPGPLPERYAKGNGYALKAGESRVWTIILGATTELDGVIPQASKDAASPIVTASQYTIEPKETFSITIFSPQKPQLEITSPTNNTESVATRQVSKNIFTATYNSASEYGLYTIVARVAGKTATASINVRHSWSDYAKSARRAAIKYAQKGGSHTESWYGLFSGYRAAEIFPNKSIDSQIDEKFDELYPLMHDTLTNLPLTYKNRIQNSALMAALLAHKYRAHKDEEDLKRAVDILDFLITKQGADGAYRNGKVHYTSVIYIAKAFMEVMEEEKILAESGSASWKAAYDRHFASVKRAIDDLTLNLDNIDTEGELTYEDGMISCSYSQIAMFALLYPAGSTEREHYTKAAQTMARGHRTLSQLLVPDARMNGGSLRYWEAQYDILTFPNMMNSPHGWSAWRIYGLKYLYQLTGDEVYLTDMINALGSCTRLLDPTTDKLNWAFVADPYIEAEQFIPDTEKPGKGKYIQTVIGEQYMPMISDWYRAEKDKWVTGYWGYDGGCCDNDVHEIFKCMGEIALTSAYAHRRADGSLILWNCKATTKGDQLVIKANESCVKTLYTNTDVKSKIKNIVKI